MGKHCGVSNPYCWLTAPCFVCWCLADSGGRDLVSLKKFVEDKLEQKCDVAAPEGCSDKEKKFIEKMSAKDADAVAKEIARLEKMKGGKMKAAQKAFLFQRLNILGQLTKAGEAAKDEL